MISFESEETKLENGIQKTKKHSLFQYIIVVAAACLVYGVMQGVHDNYGIMMNGLVEYTGISYSSISFCIGIGALVYGLGQPLFGLIALKKSNTYVILIGITLTIIGLVVTPLCKSVPSLLLFFGLVLPFGTTGLGFAIVMGAITPVLGAKRAAIVSGIVQASAGIGDALMSPALASLISEFDVRAAMSVFGILFLVMTPMAFWLRGQNKRAAEQVKEVKTEKRPIGEVVKAAFKDHDYHMIQMGFATCGFNMSIIESHLFSQFLSYGIARSAASVALTIYGIATMTGAVGTGFLGAKFSMKNVLGTTYAMRVIISLGFLFLPKSVSFAFIAAALLGFSGDATIPPTTGIISKKYGEKNMAVLYGIALIGHQCGAFASAYLGGVFVDNGMGYAPLWIVNLCLAAIAATSSYAIREK